MATLNENIARAKADFKAIKDELVNKGASIPSDTPTSQYANIIKNMSTGSSEEAYEQGRQDVIAESKYIPKTAIGKVISLTDVSEVAHKVKVYGDGQKVEVYGKNLFDISTDTRFTQQEDGSYVNNTKIVPTETPLNLPYGKYVISYDLKCAVGRNARIRIHLKDGTTVDLYQVSTNEFLHFEQVIVGEIVAWMINYSSAPNQGEVTIKNAQIEVGSLATPYEPYTKQTITATPVGTEIDSMCPNMTFIADTDITVDYYSSFGMAEKELAMWGALTNFGERTEYLRAFSYGDYSNTTIPTGLCKPRGSIGDMFYSYKGHSLPKGVDCSEFNTEVSAQTYHCYSTFAYALSIREIYDMGIPAVENYINCYRNCSNLESIEIIRVKEKTRFDNNSFNGCSKLTHCIFSGIIASDINLQWSPLLDDESLMSLGDTVIDLYDSGLGEGSRTLTLSDASKQRLKELQHPTLGSYFDYVVAYKGWKIA